MTAYEILLKAGVTALPVDLNAVAGAFHAKMMDYDTFLEYYTGDLALLYEQYSISGFTVRSNGINLCVINSKIRPLARRRWTGAHELAHVILGHTLDSPVHTKAEENECDRLAADLLAPLAILNFCAVSSAAEIEVLCGISHQAAEIRCGELCALRQMQSAAYRGLKRSGKPTFTPAEPDGAYALQNPFERGLFMNFVPFIGDYLAKRARNDDYGKYAKRFLENPLTVEKSN